VFYDLTGSEQWAENLSVDVARLERIYPFPVEQLQEILAAYPALDELAWVQEEPANMGAWGFVRPLLEQLVGSDLTVRYIGRPDKASPAGGHAAAHMLEQQAIVEEAFAGP
jgi:2-oxoglutarate dehydrogenase E1 component